jgi:diguanylate cyclase (GGDEF)-like protein/hemerythrin-like metal-binding protein
MFDIKTTFLLIIVVNFSLGLTIWPAAASERESGLYKVSFGNITHGLGYLFLILSGTFFKNVFIGFGQVLISVSVICWYSALCQFLKIKNPATILVSTVLFTACISWVFADLNVLRLVFDSAAIIFIEGLFLYSLISHIKLIRGRGKYLVFISVIVNIIILLARAEASLFGGAVKYTFDQGIYQSALYVSILSTLLCFSLGFVLMTKERTDFLNQQLIRKDSLTGLWNRRHLDEAGNAENARHIRFGVPSSLAMIDIDNFKQINDQYGHQVGDAVLVKVANCCVKTLRDTDVLGRWGGEEFMVICPDTTMQNLTQVAEQLRAAVSQIEVVQGKNISVSIGLSSCLGSDTWESWFERADKALYDAKSLGKNIVSMDFPFFHEDNRLLIKWGKAFESGIELLDRDHFNIISRINDWIRLPKEECTRHDLCDRLLAIRQEILVHFEQEDRFFAEKTGADSLVHHAMHQHLVQRLDFLIERFNRDVISLEALSHFVIYELCVQHILIDDKTFSRRLAS